MIGRKDLIPDSKGTLVERLGLGVAAGVPVEQGEVVEVDGEVGVLGAERLLVDRDGALVERLGLGVAAGVLVERGEVVEPVARSGCSGPSVFSPMAMARW